MALIERKEAQMLGELVRFGKSRGTNLALRIRQEGQKAHLAMNLSALLIYLVLMNLGNHVLLVMPGNHCKISSASDQGI